MKGRRPKPTALKVLQGNPGKRALDTLHEPQPVIGLGPCPDYVTSDPAAAEYWNSQGPQLVKLRTLGETDAATFAGLCLMHARVVWLSSRISALKARGRLTEKAENKLATYESQRIKTLAQFNKIGAEFGLGAASRTRIKLTHDDGQLELPGVSQPASPLARIMGRDRALGEIRAFTA